MAVPKRLRRNSFVAARQLRPLALILGAACGGGAVVSAGPPKFALAIKMDSVAGSAGTVTVTSAGNPLLVCATGTCTVDVAQGASVTLSAAPGDAASMFDGWSGECAATPAACTVAMDAGKLETARFRPRANLMFQTSNAIVMPFGPTGAAAQAAADQHCNASASDAGLPGRYVAWLSTATTDAISKLGSANGWRRTDGKPFANSRKDLTAGRVFYPPTRDERGRDRTLLFQNAATGTQGDGTVFTGNTCGDWTSTTGTTAGIGVPSGGSQAWTAAPFVMPCAGPFSLYCFEATQDEAITPSSTGRIAFVSNGTFLPGPGTSRANADELCQSEAKAAGLPGASTDYLAMLALTGEPPQARFSTVAGAAPWVRPDGVAIVTSPSDLAAGVQILAPIDVTADKSYVAKGIVWTGSLGTGAAGDANTTCHNWGSNANSGNGGQVEYSYHWFDEYQLSVTCLAAEPVLCFQK